MSFFDFDLLTQTATNFGLQNYREMFGASDLTWSATSMLTWRVPLLLLAGLAVVRSRRKRAGDRRTLTVTAGLLLVLVVVLGVHPGAHGAWNDQRFWAALRHTIEFAVISTPLMALGLGLAILVNRPGRLSTVYPAAPSCPTSCRSRW